jgi:probable F420-dependent oxidoreductase
MPRTRWGVVYNADTLSLDDMLRSASMAEQAGAESIWSTEGWRDAFVPLTAMASTVKTVRLGTGVAQMARPPVLTALSALSLAEYTRGRFVLGVGTAPRSWNNDWHGFDVPHPVPRIREYIECIRTVLTATTTNPITYTGTYYQVKDYVQFLAPPITQIPIYLAGVNPRMIQLAGTHSDGLILGPFNGSKYLSEIVHPNLAKGLGRANRARASVEVCAIRICAVNSDAARARNLARHGIAFYATIPYYDIVLSPLGFDREVKSIRDAFSRGDIPAMFGAVTDDMVAALALAGTPGDVRRRRGEFDGLADSVALASPYFGVSREETQENSAAILEAFAD